MKQKLRYFVTLLLLVVAGVAWADDVVFYTLSPADGSNSNYASNCDITIDGITWNVTGNSQMQPWRLGGKSISKQDREVYSKTAMGATITKVSLEVGAASSITVNSLKLIVGSSADFKNQIDEVTATFKANSTIDFVPSSPSTKWAKDAYYKFVFNVTVSGTSNKFVEFKKATFYRLDDGTPVKANATIEIDNSTIYVGETATITTDGPALTLTTSDETIASVDGSKVTGVAAGKATITATWSEDDDFNAGTKDFTIVVKPSLNKKENLTYDEISASDLKATSTNYADFSSVSKESTAVYAGQSAKSSDNAIALRATSPSGIVTTATGGKIRHILVDWNTDSDRELTVYGKNSAYTSGADLYESSAQGTKLGTISAGTSEFEITDDYAYIGVCSSKNTLYLNKIFFGWEADGETPMEKLNPELTISNMTLTEGDEETISVTTNSDGTITYASDNTSVASVADGKVTAISEGTATITATQAETETYKAATATFTVTVNKKSSEPATGDYVKVTSTDDLTDGTYLIVYEEGNLALNGGLTDKLDAVSNSIEVTISDSKIAASETVDAAAFEYDATAKTLKGAGGLYMGQTSDANGLASSATTTYENTISFDDDGNANIVSGGAYLRYNATSGQTRFRYFKSATYANQKAIALYKKAGEAVKPSAGLKFSETSVTYEIGETFTAPTLDNPNNLEVTYSSGDETLATVDEKTGVVTLKDKTGTVTIKATSPETDEFRAGEASYTITIIANTAVDVKGFKELDDETTAKLKLENAKVLYVSGKDMYIRGKEDIGYAIDFYNTGLAYTAGQVLNGTITAKKTTYKELPELTTTIVENMLVATDGEAADPWPVDVADITLADFVCDLIEVTGTITKEGNDYYVSDGTHQVMIYNKFKVYTLTDAVVGSKAAVTGIVVPYNSKPAVAITKFELTSIPVTVGSTGYATLYYGTLSVVVPENVEAYTYTVADGKLEDNYLYKAGEVIPAKTGVVLKAEQGTYDFEVTTREGVVDDDNLLMGLDADGLTVAPENGEGDYVFYKLTTKGGKNVGFYYGEADGAAFTTKANKAYLAVPVSSAAGVKSFLLGDDATAIEGLTTEGVRQSDAIYNLAGQKVTRATKGVFIVGGKKVVR